MTVVLLASLPWPTRGRTDEAVSAPLRSTGVRRSSVAFIPISGILHEVASRKWERDDACLVRRPRHGNDAAGAS
jgi:hypothetical protein